MNQILLIIIILLLSITIILAIFFLKMLHIGWKTFFALGDSLSQIQYNLIHERYSSNRELYGEVYDYLIELERKEKIYLSYEAKQLLILPLVEVQKHIKKNTKFDKAQYYEFEDSITYWKESTSKIIEYMKYEPARFDRVIRVDQDQRTSISVIKAFANRFCNIPPFCGEK